MSFNTGRPTNPNIREVNSNGLRIKGQLIELYRYDGSVNAIRSFDITNPSTRIAGWVEVFFEQDGDTLVADYDSTWNIAVYARGVNKGENTLNLVDPPGPPISALTDPDIPRSYSWQDSGKIVRVRLNLGVVQDSGGFPIQGTWYARVYWEPTDSTIEENELQKMFSECQIKTGVGLE